MGLEFGTSVCIDRLKLIVVTANCKYVDVVAVKFINYSILL